jgi:hypothetical protein
MSETGDAPQKHKGGWHSWYAWRPVKTNGRVAWLETVRRRNIHSWRPHGVAWEYECPSNVANDW